MSFKLGHGLIPPIGPWANYHGSSRTALTFFTYMKANFKSFLSRNVLFYRDLNSLQNYDVIFNGSYLILTIANEL